MAKFRKIPVIIEAEQFFADKVPLPFHDKKACNFDGERWFVITAHGQEATIVDSDWIVPEPEGHQGFYPIKADIFARNYEATEE